MVGILSFIPYPQLAHVFLPYGLIRHSQTFELSTMGNKCSNSKGSKEGAGECDYRSPECHLTSRKPSMQKLDSTRNPCAYCFPASSVWGWCLGRLASGWWNMGSDTSHLRPALKNILQNPPGLSFTEDGRKGILFLRCHRYQVWIRDGNLLTHQLSDGDRSKT